MDYAPRRILWPTDFSALSREAARFVRSFAAPADAELHLVHVVSPPLAPDPTATLPADAPLDYPEAEIIEACRRQLDRLVRAEFPDVAHVVKDVFVGSPWSSICDYADAQAIELLIIATHGRTGLRHLLVGSTAERIVQHAPCPVLVIKGARSPEHPS